jgi:putative ABC transport system permease protein
VRRQFLLEAIVLGLIGGVIGILFGVASSFAVSNLLEWPILIPPFAIVLSTLFAIAIAVFFGFYPARKASQLNPIEALRYE